jgi:mRNA interferase MazF
MVKIYIPERADIVWLDFSPQAGHEQAGRRPALVLSPLSYNKNGMALVCPITSKAKGYPFEVVIKNDKINGVILSDHIKNHDWQARKLHFISKANLDVINAVAKNIFSLLVK